MGLNAISGLALGLIPLLFLLFPVPFLLRGARTDRKLIAATPGLFGSAVYIATFLASYWSAPPVSNSILWLHSLASAIPLLLLAPSAMALRSKWLSIAHLITLIGIVGAWLVGGVLIDGTS